MQQYLIIGSACAIALVIVIVILHFIRGCETKYYKDKIKNLETQRNVVASTPVLLELTKVEPIIKNDRMEEKYNRWQDDFIKLKENRLTLIDDMLIDLDIFVDKRDYKSCYYRMAKVEMEIYKVKEAADHILGEIKDITLSEEKYRSIVTKLKTKYRVLNKEFQDHKAMYEEMADSISLQLENIEKRFLDFEKVMENNDYNEVSHIVKALDAMIEHMEIIVNEVPDVLLMAKKAIPNRIKEIKMTYDDMLKQEFPLDYLNIDYNLEEIDKNIEVILEKVRVLNLEGCMFDLKTMLEYLDSLFIDFEKERLSRKVYEEVENDFSKKIEKTNKLVSDIYAQLDDIKRLYDLKEEDIETIHNVNKQLVIINDDYKNVVNKVEAKSSPYSIVNKEMEDLTVRLKNLEIDLDKSLKSLGNMYDDEVRAREQLDEIQMFLKQCKTKMRSYKLPIITDNYFVQLSEANEAILEVIKELEKKPIAISILNTRVDTARDLVLKLYNTTVSMIKTAKMSEMAIVYGNRYIPLHEDIEEGINRARNLFFKGDYTSSLKVSVDTIKLVDDNFERKLLAYEKE